MEHCQDCGSTHDVQQGRCATCRRLHVGHGEDQVESPRDASIEPAHDQPWVPRSAFTDRLRRNPRK